MKMKSIGLIFLLLFFITGLTVSAETLTDPTADVAHWNYTQAAWGWNQDIGTKSDIDITALRQSESNDQMIIEIEVAGTIQTSELIFYSAWFNTSDAYYWLYWSNGQGSGLATSTSGEYQMSPGTITVTDNTITATFDVVGTDTTAEDFWGYAWEYTSLTDFTTAEWWGDWAPNDESPFYGADDTTGDDTTGDDTTGDDTTGDDTTGDDTTGDDTNNDQESSGTPGFEILLILTAILTFILITKRK